MPQPSPDVLIERIRESFDESVVVFTMGSCYKLFLILRTIYPDAEAYYDWNVGHVYTKIDGSYYDIKGKHVFAEGDLEPMANSHLLRNAHRWKYTG